MSPAPRVTLTVRNRIRMLKEEAHSQKLAEAAVGLGTDNGRPRQTEKDAAEREMMMDA